MCSITKEDINQKFLRSLPPFWNQIALIMKNKPDIDEIDIDDLYNNLRVYEDEMKRSSSSISTSQNLAFLSSENTSSTNEVSTASGDFEVSTAGGISQVSTTPCAHDVVCSFFAQPTISPQLENEDFQQIDEDDLEELDLRWQGTLLGNADLERIKGEDLMVTISSDEENTPANDRFSKADGYHAVPPPITGNFLTPRDDISFAGKTNEANTQKPKTDYESVNKDKVIIKDWNSDNKDDVSEVQTVSSVKTNETQTVKTRVDKIGHLPDNRGIGFKKK
ncbi:hypothetical protein Tco_0525751 [Tanacetum coccineum]